jgi:CRP/FNR family transcriptional regulator, polysaccharide utilization system transcription regulator
MKTQPITGCNFESFYKPNSVFRHILQNEVQQLSGMAEPMTFKKGSYIYHEGSRITGCHFIQSGIVKIYKTGTDGKEQIIRFAKPGELIGFRSVFSNEPACTTAQVHDDTLTCFIPSEIMINLVKTNGNFALDLVHLTCKELGEANEYITDIAQKTVRERLAEILLQLKNNFGIDHEQFLQINLTREEMANLVGTATESVIRLLSEFKDDQIIELQGRKIKILNLAQLVKTANL